MNYLAKIGNEVVLLWGIPIKIIFLESRLSFR